MDIENNNIDEPDIYENTVYLNTLIKKISPEFYDALTGHQYLGKRWMVLLWNTIRVLLIAVIASTALMWIWPENMPTNWLWFCIALISVGSVIIVQSLMSFRVEILFEDFIESLIKNYETQEHQKFIYCIQNNLYVKICVTSEDLQEVFNQTYTKESAVVKNILLGSLKLFVNRYYSKRFEQNNNRANKVDDTK